MVVETYRKAESTEVVGVTHPFVYLIGTARPDLQVEPAEPGETISFKVWADRIYDRECFESFVEATLSDPRSWPGIRPAEPGETPQFWVTLTAPAGACATFKNPRQTCTWNNGDGTGFITVNALRWSRGYGFGDSDRRQLINHEVGHILSVGHSNCSVMGAPRWTPAAGYPRYESEYDGCARIPAWPHGALKTRSQESYQAWFGQ
jgi:hypothetical protein